MNAIKKVKLCNMVLTPSHKNFIYESITPYIIELAVKNKHIIHSYGYKSFMNDPIIKNELESFLAQAIKKSIENVHGLDYVIKPKYKSEIANLKIADFVQFIECDVVYKKIIKEICKTVDYWKVEELNHD